MDFGLRGKVALVAAGSAGLGLAVATELAREGARVAICGRDRLRLNAAAQAIRAAGSADAFAVEADVSQSEQARRFVEEAAAHFGRVDILVMNAGGPPSGEFLDLDEEAWRKGVDLTLMSAVNLCYAVVPHMRRAGGGRIIAIASVSVKQPLRNLTLSNSIRAAVVGLTKTLSIELAPYNILVNSVLPGWTRTQRVDELMNARAEKQNVQRAQIEAGIVDGIPLKRMGEPEEFAAVVTFLASARASYVTGTAIPVDGGSIRTPF
jgi:3-oxoacyl-[acyl-carrier protein] reductase